MQALTRLFKIISFLVHVSRSARRAQLAVSLAIVAGVISGISNAGLIALINTALNNSGGFRRTVVWNFALLCLLLPTARFVSNALLVRLTARAMLALRVQLCRQILAARLRLLEELGPHRLLATLTDDVPTISSALASLPLLCMHIAIVVGCIIYLAWLSWKVCLGVSFFLLLATISYQVPLMRASRYFRLFRENWDALVKHFHAVTEGTKELKLHRKRRAAFLYEVLLPTAKSLERYHVKGSDIFMLASSWGHILIFILIGLLLFALPGMAAVDSQILSGYVLTLLYVMVPMEMILNKFPEISRASIAVEKIDSLGLSLVADFSEEESQEMEATAQDWQQLELSQITHSYHLEKGNKSFSVGPIDLTLRRGELVFMTGGNGSGKTTLAKLLVGLYVPESGEIRLDGQPVTDETRELYRQHFSAVFSDFFLFETLLGLDYKETDTQIRDYLSQLQLDHKVQVVDGSLSAIELSQGQRKRLALLTAFLEDRPIYVFDEWAADQDPVFKKVFYLDLLPELKARGKTVVVISHDDRYYHVADRIIKLDYGKIESDGDVDNPLPPTLLAETPQVFASVEDRHAGET